MSADAHRSYAWAGDGHRCTCGQMLNESVVCDVAAVWRDHVRSLGLVRVGKRGGKPWITSKAHARATSRLRTRHPDEFAVLLAGAISELEAEDANRDEEPTP